MLAPGLETDSEHLDTLVDFDSILGKVSHGLTLAFFYLRGGLAKTFEHGLKFLLCVFNTAMLGLLQIIVRKFGSESLKFRRRFHLFSLLLEEAEMSVL